MLPPKVKRLVVGYLFLLPYLVLFAFFIVCPLVYSLGLSFYRWELASTGPPLFVGVDNYTEALHSSYFWRALWATARFVLMSVPLLVVFGLLIALGINSTPRKRQGFYRAAFFVPCMISISVAGLLWRWFYNSEFGVFNSMLEPLNAEVGWVIDPAVAMKSIVLMSLWWTIGTPVVIFLAGLQSVPKSYYEAALIEGATAPQRLFWITLPTIRPIILFVVVINTIASFQVFGQTFIITSGGPELSTRVLVQYIYEVAFSQYRMGYGAAVSWLLFLVVAAFSLIQLRLFRERQS